LSFISHKYGAKPSTLEIGGRACRTFRAYKAKAAVNVELTSEHSQHLYIIVHLKHVVAKARKAHASAVDLWNF